MTKKSKWQSGRPKVNGWYWTNRNWFSPLLFYPVTSTWYDSSCLGKKYRSSDRWIGPLIRPKLPKEKSHEAPKN